MKVLLVEDDLDLSAALSRVLTRRGMAIDHCTDGVQALVHLGAGQYDVVMLDLGLPVMDGLQLVAKIRATGNEVPVLVVTARGSVGDRIAKLNDGTDDYLAKPFDLDELEARLRALCLRANGHAGAMRCGRLRVERASHVAYVDGRALELTPRESALLAALMERPGHAVTKERLTALVFPADQATQSDAVEVVAHRLRKKLLDTDVQITTLRGVGYLIQELGGSDAEH